ncbi:hypothetical protein HY639_04740 [Candidatus Woesearchaeota archaeon]|nr:hypothetical protein [Candidatus Woesearchaeota archaeon]
MEDRMYHLEENLGMLQEGIVSAMLIKYTLERIRHPVTREHLSICLVCTETGQCDRAMDHVESLDHLLCQNIPEIDAHIIVAPEYTYHRETQPLTEKQHRHFLRRQCRVTEKTDALVIPGTFVWAADGKVRNIAYLLQRGNVIGQYQKRKDGGEGSYASDFGLQYVRGTELGLVDWEGLRLGIEICADSGILSDNGINDRDILFLVSCGLDRQRKIPSGSCLRKGGYGFVNDGYQPAVLAYRRQV